jgi:hypothetical protein
MITASEILWSLIQDDGRFAVRERLVDDQNNEFLFDYLATPDIDQNAHLAQRVIEANG